MIDPVIREEDEENMTETENEVLRFRIKNLDTGEEEEIENEEQEEILDKKLSAGRHGKLFIMQK